MPDMHGFGDIGTGIVDDHRLPLPCLFDAKVRIGFQQLYMRRQCGAGKEEIDETGACNFNFFDKFSS